MKLELNQMEEQLARKQDADQNPHSEHKALLQKKIDMQRAKVEYEFLCFEILYGERCTALNIETG